MIFLRTSKNSRFSTSEKERIIKHVVLDNESVCSVAIPSRERLLVNGILFNWIKKYKGIGYNIVERKQGQSTIPKVTKKMKLIKKK